MTNVSRVIEQISLDKGIEQDILIAAIEEALKSAAKKKFGTKVDIEVNFNEELGEIEAFQFKEVVDNEEDIIEPDLQISIDDGKKIDPECELGDSLGFKMDIKEFGRIAAQSAKQVIIQKLRNAERNAVYSNFIEKKGQIVNGIIQRFEKKDIVVNLGQAEAVIPFKEQVPNEVYNRNDRIRAYVVKIQQDGKGPQIILSRTHTDFLIKLFTVEVPEINEGIVSIVSASREPGVRSKIAVSSNDPDVDPVGACVGIKGVRVQNVVQELKNEKIDIVPWYVSPAKFVCSALAPAEVSKVIIDETNRQIEVIVPNESLSIAIGKKGQNVRLASKLMRWHLDVINENQYNSVMEKGCGNLMVLPGVGITIAQSLFDNGFSSIESIAQANVENMFSIKGLAEDSAKKLIKSAKKYLEDSEKSEQNKESISVIDNFENVDLIQGETDVEKEDL